MQSAFRSSVFDKVIHAIEQTTFIEGPAIWPSTRLADDLALGGFGRLKLAVYLEEVFEIELPDEAVEGFVVVADIVDYFSGRYFRDIELPALALALAA
jgi:acyl carrier protein